MAFTLVAGMLPLTHSRVKLESKYGSHLLKLSAQLLSFEKM